MPRRRPALAIPGWLLLGCLFLPTLRVCGDPTTPLEFPPTYVLYLGSAVVGVLAWTRRRRVRQGAYAVLLGLWCLSIAGIGFAFVAADAGAAAVVAVPPLLAIVALVVHRTWRSPAGERAIAIGVVFHALAATAWNALLASDPDAMWGAQVALAASIAMLAAAGSALGDAYRGTRPTTLPPARARRATVRP